MRKKIVIGNWKMNMTRQETRSLLTIVKESVKDSTVDVAFAVPFTDIETATGVLEDTEIIYEVLSMEDQKLFDEGITVKNQEELAVLLQDFES